MSAMPFYVVHAFVAGPFTGNPAAICFDDEFLDDAVMQRIAAENRLSETAFLTPRDEDEDWNLRWFTPEVEVSLCGHATLAAACVVFQDIDPGVDRVTFHTSSGPLRATWLGEERGVRIDLPRIDAVVAKPDPALGAALRLAGAPEEARRTATGRWLLRLADETAVRTIEPDMGALRAAAPQGVIVTAPGVATDVASRFFAPALGVPEDPVTGSAHALLVPYWCERLGVKRVHCAQVGPRGGRLVGEPSGDRVALEGRAALYVRGELMLA